MGEVETKHSPLEFVEPFYDMEKEQNKI